MDKPAMLANTMRAEIERLAYALYGLTDAEIRIVEDPNITNGDGDVQIINLEGQIKLNLEDGNVLCERLAGDLNLRVEDAQLKIHQSAFASCRVTMEDGTIACDGVTGNLDLELEDGSVKVDRR